MYLNKTKLYILVCYTLNQHSVNILTYCTWHIKKQKVFSHRIKKHSHPIPHARVLTQNDINPFNVHERKYTFFIIANNKKMYRKNSLESVQLSLRKDSYKILTFIYFMLLCMFYAYISSINRLQLTSKYTKQLLHSLCNFGRGSFCK